MTIRVEAAVFFRVVDPVKAVVAIRDDKYGVLRIAQTTLLATISQHNLDDLLAKQAAINELLKQIIDAGTEAWGVNVVKVETKDVGLPVSARAQREDVEALTRAHELLAREALDQRGRHRGRVAERACGGGRASERCESRSRGS